MKKIYFLFTLFTLLSLTAFAQGTENFDNSTVPASYSDGSFTGTDATWTYTHSRDQGDYPINGNGIMLRRANEPSSLSATISGGIGNFSVNTRKAFTGGAQRKLELLANGVVVAQFEPEYGAGEDTTVIPFIVEDINIPGDVDVMLRLYGSDGNQQMVLDDISWTGYTGVAIPTVAITSPGDNDVLIAGTTSTNVEFTTANLAGGETVTVTVNGTATANATSPFEVATTDGETYVVNVDLLNGTEIIDSDTVTFTVGTVNQVANISELRASNLGEVYELTGEAIISYIVTENTRNQKYIQDGGAGILIDDSAGTLSTQFNIGDGITGLQGELSNFNGTLQFVPTANVDAASSTGNTLAPIVITAAELISSGDTYQSRLIALNNVTFSDAGVFTDNTSYDVANGSDVTVCRVAFGDEDLIGTDIPTTAVSITGIGAQFSGTTQIMPRYLSDIAEPMSVNDFNANVFSLYPNPTTSGNVTITTTSNDAMNVQVFDILGKQVKNETLTNNTLNIANLKSGVYIVKITQNNTSTTKKLVIK
ncbi:putative secreted protein (Por secretion system target) [Winogradskyella epiphytica]|uniref:Putative secreted protein (Por secretion system target) n=1 Tax=Winogradskyella epiphytica TaxID=262005 RepID=A0A2V4YGF7_9FLAO|nr:T9SS type A sorting domain-containing protein [Winogradskyella epiphytica]PYE83003.1 putative secreted protein (Por secretion system target) [Winogradskyella epiphytica]GGW55106.1 hypothetical protein GCM10008085_03020 [Winogradskyella epiphytica]